MAGDWIKVRTDLHEDPAVTGIATATGLDSYGVVGRLQKLWSWADQQSRDGHVSFVTEKWIDAHIERDGFARSMVKVGWLRVYEGGVEFPKFDRHNGKSAKNRALAKDRKVTQRSRENGDNSVTREEKRRSKAHSLTSGTSPTPGNPTQPQEIRGRSGAKTVMPANFGVSERVRKWAAGKGFGRLEEHLEAFKAKSCKLGLTYANWDSAFQEAVREDWAGLRGKNGNHAAGAPASAWRAGGEPDRVLIAAGELLEIAPWDREGGETHGQFRGRIVAAGGESMLRANG